MVSTAAPKLITVPPAGSTSLPSTQLLTVFDLLAV